MTEPTYEELKARLADLEKQVDTKEKRRHRVPREREGRRQRVRTRPLSGGALMTNSGRSCSTLSPILRFSLKKIRAS